MVCASCGSQCYFKSWQKAQIVALVPTLYLTLSPCKECAKLIHQSGIKRLVYSKQYKDISGLKFLEKAQIEIQQIKLQDFEK